MGGALAWSKTYGGTFGDGAYSVVQTCDGGYALAGATYSFGDGSDFWLVKTDAIGNQLWNQTYGGTGDEEAFSLIETVDGGYSLAGYSGGDFWLVKTDSAGRHQWNRTYGGTGIDVACSVVETSDEGYALAGYTDSFGAGGYDVWLVKTNSTGHMQWSRTYGGTNNDGKFLGDLPYVEVVQTDDGGYAFATLTYSFGVPPRLGDFWLVKTNRTGNLEWNCTYGGTAQDWAVSLVQTVDGGYAIAGTNGDFLLVKTDSAGKMQWNKTYGGTGVDWAWSVVQTCDGGYALAGETGSFGAGSDDFWLVKTDSAGNALWNKTYGGIGRDRAYSLVQTSDGGYALAGYTYSYDAGANNFWLVKVNPEMNLEHQRHLGGTDVNVGWSKTYGGTFGDGAYSMVQTGDGGYALAGWARPLGAEYADVCLVKTDAVGTMLWNKTYGRADEDDFARSVVQTGDGGYALAGNTFSFGADGFLLVKIDSAGNALWSQTYDSGYYDYCYAMVQASDGGYALAGQTSIPAFGSSSLLIKTDSAGNEQWRKTYDSYGHGVAHSVIQTVDGGYALAGMALLESPPGSADFWLIKTDAAGNVLLNKTYGRADWDQANSVIQTNDGGYALAGYTGLGPFDPSDFWLVKTDSAGNELWNKTYDRANLDWAYSVVQTGDSGYAMTGWSEGDFWLVKTDSTGTIQWSKTFGGASNDEACSVVQTGDGGYALAGYTASFGAGGYDLWLVKTDVEMGLARTGLTNNAITLYRGKTDLYWNYVRVRIWTIKEPTWIYGDINMDGVVDVKDLYIVSRNYGKTFSLLSLSGIIAIAGIRIVKKPKQSKQASYIS